MVSAVAAIESLRPETLPSLRMEWEALWCSAKSASPFLSPAWLLAWGEAFAPGKVHAVTLRSGGELVAVLPVFAWEGALLLAGTGPSDHAGLLCKPGFEDRAGELVEAAGRINLPFERIDFQQLSPESPLARVEIPAWQAESGAGDACLVLPLGGADGMAHVPRKMHGNWRNAINRIAQEGGVIELVPQQEIGAAVAALEMLHTMRWSARGQSGVLAGDMMQHLVRAAAPALCAMGLLRLFRLRMGVRTAAMLFAMQDSARACFFISGFDPEIAHLSPGTALVGHAIRHATSEGVAEFDFLRGAERYKSRWGAGERRRIRRIFTRPG